MDATKELDNKQSNGMTDHQEDNMEKKTVVAIPIQTGDLEKIAEQAGCSFSHAYKWYYLQYKSKTPKFHDELLEALMHLQEKRKEREERLKELTK